MSEEFIKRHIDRHIDATGEILMGIPIALRNAFKSRLSKWLAVVFLSVFATEFVEKANLGGYRSQQEKWSGFTHGVWEGSIAVLMVLAFIVLWNLANKDSKEPPSS